jgi:hypothetical protein
MEEQPHEVVLTPEEEEFEYNLYLQMKQSPEWDVLPKPARWYKKYNIPPVKAISLAEYLQSDYHNKCKFLPHTGEAIIIDEPQRGGVMVPLQEVKDELTFTLHEKPFEGKLTFDEGINKDVVTSE